MPIINLRRRTLTRLPPGWTIQANAPAPNDMLACTAPVVLAAGQAAADGSKGPPTFSMLAYSGGIVEQAWSSYGFVIDLKGLKFHKKIVANYAHEEKQIVGLVTKHAKTATDIRLEGVISGTGPGAQEVLNNAANGFPWDASVEVKILRAEFVEAGAKVKVNGTEFSGPMQVVRAGLLYGVAFVGRGADSGTNVKIAAKDPTTMDFDAWLSDQGFDAATLTDKQVATLKLSWQASQAPPPPPPTKKKAARQPAAEEDETPPAFDAGDIRLAAEEAGELLLATCDNYDGVASKEVATIRAAGRKSIKDLRLTATQERWTIDRFGREAERVVSQAELKLIRAERPHGPAIHASTKALTGEVLEAACSQSRKYPAAYLEKRFKPEVLDQAHGLFRGGLGLQQLILVAASANGMQVAPGERLSTATLRQALRFAFMQPESIRAGFTPVSLPGILSNVANKELLDGYMEEDQTWREVAGVKSVSDFKQATSYRLLDNMEYLELSPGGELQHGSLGEESYTRQAKTYGLMFSLDRTMLINDDLGAFGDLRDRIGRGAAKALNNVFWKKWLSLTFWSTANTNYIEGATSNLGIDGVGLELAVKAFYQMRSPTEDGKKRVGGPVVGGRPEILLCPPESMFTAERLFASTLVNTGGAATATSVPNENIHARKYRPVVSPWLSDTSLAGYSTTAFYLLRNPANGAAVCVSFLNGNQTPIVESAEADFNMLGIQIRGYHDFGCDAAEKLAGIKSKGAA